MKRTSCAFAGVTACTLLLTFVAPGSAQVQVEENVVYGMYSGLALLMDVHRPVEPNGYGIVHISGSGWHMPLGLNAQPLKERRHVQVYAKPLAEAGYTVFTINHRAAPRFRYPAAVEDAQRAVRFVRQHAADYGIDGERIGAMGGSSGGHLVSMLGVLDGAGNPDDPDPVNRISAKVQCVVARAPLTDFLKSAGNGAEASFLGLPRPRPQADPDSPELETYVEASPISHVSADDPPFLFLHGDADQTVPFEQSELMHAALTKSGIEAEVFRIPGGGHGPTFGNVASPPDYVGAAVQWFDDCLREE